MPFRGRSSHQTKTAVLIGLLSLVLYVLLGLAFFACLSITNVFLVHVNRTLGTTLLTYTAMSVAMHAVYGGYEVGRKKAASIVDSLRFQPQRAGETGDW